VAEKLSQDQIDELLKSMASGEEQSETASSSKDKKIKEYNFQNPKIFNKEQTRTLHIIHDNYARHLTSFLSGMLRTNCHLSVKSVEELRYYEYNNALPESILMGVLDMPPLEGNVLIEFARPLVYLMIDRLLGGTGDMPEDDQPDEFSDIELNIMSRFYRQIIVFFKEAWASVAEVSPSVNRIETNSRLTQIMPLDETVVVIGLDVTIKETQGQLSICLPGINLDELLGHESTRFMFVKKRGSQNEAEEKQIVLDNVKRSEIEVRGILGNARLSLADIMHLQVGDVISLDKHIGSSVQVCIGNKPYFTGDLGTRKSRMAIRVKNVV